MDFPIISTLHRVKQECYASLVVQEIKVPYCKALRAIAERCDLSKRGGGTAFPKDRNKFV